VNAAQRIGGLPARQQRGIGTMARASIALEGRELGDRQLTEGPRYGLWGARRFGLRLGGAIVVILGVVTLTFLLSRVFTANPVSLFVSQTATPQMRAQLSAQLGLGDPLLVQYARFLGDLLHGNLGTSFLTGRSVTSDLLLRLPATLELAVYALIGGVAAGLVAGVIAAVRKGGIIDQAVRLITIGAVSLPQFWVGLMLLWIFFVKLGVAPGPSGRLPVGVSPPRTITGFYVVDSLLEGQWSLAVTAARQLILPVLTLGLGVFAPIARTTRSAMIEALDADYIRTANALGVPRRRIWFSYALKNSMLPVLTIMAGVVGWVFSGSVLVEGIFAWPGVGNYALNAIQSSDYPAVQGFVIYGAILYVIIIALLEYAYTLADPRVRR
jgi:ABC-type dipeptide/oligopeptide/nickel transport system permease component